MVLRLLFITSATISLFLSCSTPNYHTRSTLPLYPDQQAALNSRQTTPPRKQATNNTQPKAVTQIQSKTPPKKTTHFQRHIVQRKETLSSISRLYRIDVKDLMSTNKLRSTEISVGQSLIIPGVASQRRATTAQKYGQPNIISRKRWAKTSIKGNITPMGSVNKITVHHTTAPTNLWKLTDVNYISIIEKAHQQKKWACIGYHFIIGRNGSIYEGRPLKYQGAHASGSNPNNLGIALIGDFNKKLPNSMQLASLKALLNNLRTKYKLQSSQVYGHKHLVKTECPGVMLEQWLFRYRSGKL